MFAVSGTILIKVIKKLLGLSSKQQKKSMKSWVMLERQQIKGALEGVSVILPVYRDTQLTEKCIEAALPSIQSTSSKLYIINDASPDNDMQSMLNEKQETYPDTIELITNKKNLGFVKSVNKGFDVSEGNDVVLLNSDVIVGESSWLERLRHEAYSSPSIGTVTPLSNNTTISAFPNFLEENLLPFGLSVKDIDQSFSQLSLPNITAPTGIGFCMYIRRACIKDVGNFDEKSFGRGYGEENDFCQRAIKKGWLNVITPNIYAYHKGGVSFGDEKESLVTNALMKLHDLHPDYHNDVRTFIESDFLRPARIIRTIELMKASSLPVILHVSHGLGGGVDQHIRELAEHVDEDAISIMLIPVPNTNKVKLRLGWQDSDNEIIFDLDKDEDAFLSITKSIPLLCIHYHHIMNVPDCVLALAQSLGIPYQFTVHDYYLLNGNPTLTNQEFIYPGQYDDELHNPFYPLPEGMTAEDWRTIYKDFWENAERVIFPSQATKDFFEGFYPQDKAVIVWHPESKRDMTGPLREIVNKNKYRIGVLGALSREKGADYLEDIASFSRKNNMSYEFVLLGFAYRKLKNIEETGRYRESELQSLIDERNLDVILFPARWPETYSYTLSYAIQSGLPIIAPEIGAFTERLQERHNALLFKHHSTPEELLISINDFIEDLSGKTVKLEDYARGFLNRSDSFYLNEYFSCLSSRESEHTPMLSSQDFQAKLQVLNSKECAQKRHSLLSYLGYLYNHPYSGFVRKLFPPRIALRVKKLLKGASS